ncbi:MAG: hypothetical protein Q9218_002814 [Villophora microphyllina]
MAETMYNAFNSAFLTRSGGDVFYKTALNNADKDGTWSASLDILGVEDAYERTGDPEKKTLLNDLLTTWLKFNPADGQNPWSWDGWNDDIGWFTLALIRGYQMTGNQAFLDAAERGFNYAFQRGWETQHNGGGIWEENPEYTAKENPPRQATKEALANDSLGKVGCMIYQSTHDEGYLRKGQQIYAWVKANLVDSKTGQVNTGVDQSGKVDTGTAVYNQGTFLDYANLLYEITGNQDYYDDAKRAIDFGRNSLTTNGVFNNDQGYLNTWADEMARGVGHFVRDNHLWSEYYTWMKQNADAILQNRRTDLGITWNAWAQPTPGDNALTANKFVSAMAWLQFTPETQVNETGGIRVITNQKTGMAIDSAGKYGNGSPVIQWGKTASLNQRWLLTQNSDYSWNIVNLATWQSLDCPGGKDTDSLPMVQWFSGRDNNQRWWIDQQEDGTYKIWNKASEKSLDNGGSANNGAALIQFGWNGNENQRWLLQ